MYNNISNAAKTALRAKAVTTTARITLTSDNTVIDGNNLINVTITDQCYQDGIIVGTAMCKEVEIELMDNSYDLADKEFSLEVGVLLSNNTYEYIPFGNFIVKEYKRIVSSNHYRIIAYDYMDKFNATFIDPNDYEEPITLQDFYESLADYYDVTIETQANLPNADFSISTKPYFDGMSGREVLSRVAEMMGSFAKINRENKLEMRLRNTTAESFSREQMNSSLEIDNQFGPINVIVLRLSQVEGENVTKRDESSITQHGETTLQIQDNPFCYSEALRLAAIDAIYDRVDGFWYVPTTFNGKLIYLDTGDEVVVQNMSTDTYYKTIILKQVLKIPSTRSSKFENKALTSTAVAHQFTPDQVRKDRRTEYLVDKQNGEITALVETVEEVEETVTTVNEEMQNLLDTTGTAEGKYIYIDDASDNTLISARFDGETSQATRSGKNLLNITATTQEVNGITYTINEDKSIKINGTASALSYIQLTSVFALNGTYTLSGGNNLSNSIYMRGLNIDNSYSVDFYTTTTPTNTVNSRYVFYLYVANGTNVNNLIIYPQLESGSSATSYEQYGVMPSPDYPSKIVNLEGRDIFDGIFELGIINGNTGQNSDNSSYIRNKNYIPVEELTNYKFSTDSTLFTSVQVYEYKKDFTYNLSMNKSIALSSALTTNAGTKYIRFRPAASFTDTNIKVQIEKRNDSNRICTI